MASKTTEPVKMDSEQKVETSEEFVKVERKSRKRKMKTTTDNAGDSMDMTEVAPKRPYLPEISGENLVVSLFTFLFLEFVQQ